MHLVPSKCLVGADCCVTDDITWACDKSGQNIKIHRSDSLFLIISLDSNSQIFFFLELVRMF